MQKKLIALAIAGLSTAAFAQSNVTIYGQIQPSYDIVHIKNNNADNAHITGMSNNASRIGFKGEEALGNGLKAFFQIETYLGVSDKNGFNGDAANTGARDSFVGLSGGFGAVSFGAMDTAYKKTFATYDWMADSTGDMNTILTNGPKDRSSSVVNSTSRPASGMYYASPVFSGFQASASYALGQSNLTSGNGSSTDNRVWSLAGDYTNGPVKATLAYGESLKSNADANDKLWRLGGQYTLPTNTLLQAIWEKNTENGAAGKTKEQKNWLLGVKHPIGNFELIASYGKKADDTVATGENGARMYVLGAQYNLSKRTNVLAMYTDLKNDANGATKLDSSDSYNSNNGGKVTAASVRLQHKF